VFQIFDGYVYRTAIEHKEKNQRDNLKCDEGEIIKSYIEYI